MKFLLGLLWDPIKTLDLVDSKGDADHGKVMGLFIFCAFYLLILLKLLPSVGHTIVLASAAYGSIMFRTFLKSRAVTSSEIIQEERDTEHGFQPTP